MTKQEIRENVLTLRRDIALEKRHLFDQLIFERAHKHKVFQRARTVHVFRSTREEIETMPFIEYAWAIGKTVVVPRIDATTSCLEHVVIDRRTHWTPGQFGIMEPTRDGSEVLIAATELSSTDAVIVPIVAFDRECHRIGYGKGYYDGFLATTPAVKIGIAYECQRVQMIPTEPHDVRLDAIATEERWYAPSSH